MEGGQLPRSWIDHRNWAAAGQQQRPSYILEESLRKWLELADVERLLKILVQRAFRTQPNRVQCWIGRRNHLGISRARETRTVGDKKLLANVPFIRAREEVGYFYRLRKAMLGFTKKNTKDVDDSVHLYKVFLDRPFTYIYLIKWEKGYRNPLTTMQTKSQESDIIKSAAPVGTTLSFISCHRGTGGSVCSSFAELKGKSGVVLTNQRPLTVRVCVLLKLYRGETGPRASNRACDRAMLHCLLRVLCPRGNGVPACIY